MRLLVSGASATVSHYLNSEHLGHLVVPRAGNSIRWILSTGLPWAVDNDAFSGFDPVAFCTLLGKTAGKERCLFVACPDVVGDAKATLQKFRCWQPLLKEIGVPVAFVGQDGLKPDEVPWGEFEVFFVGGSTEWKLGPEAAELVRQAKKRGCRVHMGRCNSRKRFRYAHGLGCDTLDGSGFSRWPGQRIPKAVGWLEELEGKPRRPKNGSEWTPTGRSQGEDLLGPGWIVNKAESRGKVRRFWVEYRVEPRDCSHCGEGNLSKGTLHRHGIRTRQVKDLPQQGRASILCIRQRRYRCCACSKTFLQPLPGITSRSKTERLRAAG